MNSDETSTIYLVDQELAQSETLLNEFRASGYVVLTPDAYALTNGNLNMSRPCVVVIDLRIAKQVGWLDQQQNLPERYKVPVVLVADQCTVEDAITVMEYGAVTLQMKPVSVEKLVPHITRAIEEDYRSAIVSSRYSETHRAIEDLTPRQRTILSMVAEGKTTKQIAMLLDVSVRLVEQERSTILRQFKVLSTPEVTVKIGEFRALRLMNTSTSRQTPSGDDPMSQFLDRF